MLTKSPYPISDLDKEDTLVCYLYLPDINIKCIKWQESKQRQCLYIRNVISPLYLLSCAVVNAHIVEGPCPT